MKKKICIILGLSLILFVSFIRVNAFDSSKEVSYDSKLNENYLSEWNDNDKVIHLPGGGYLKGEATLHKDDGTVIVYNSETDPNAITVAEQEEMFLRNNKKDGDCNNRHFYSFIDLIFK